MAKQYRWVLFDLSNGDIMLPAYVWVCNTKAEASNNYREHANNPALSRLSKPTRKDNMFMRYYEPVPNCIDSRYWRRKE